MCKKITKNSTLEEIMYSCSRSPEVITSSRYKKLMKKYVLPHLGIMKLKEIGVLDIEGLIDYLQGNLEYERYGYEYTGNELMSTKTMVGIYNALRVTFCYACKEVAGMDLFCEVTPVGSSGGHTPCFKPGTTRIIKTKFGNREIRDKKKLKKMKRNSNASILYMVFQLCNPKWRDKAELRKIKKVINKAIVLNIPTAFNIRVEKKRFSFNIKQKPTRGELSALGRYISHKSWLSGIVKEYNSNTASEPTRKLFYCYDKNF